VKKEGALPLTGIEELFEQHALATYDKQVPLAEIVGEGGWHVDLKEGRLSFESGVSFAIQVLGSQSGYDNTWLWAWANDMLDVESELLQASLTLRKYGHAHNVVEFITDKFPITAYDGHYLSIVATGLCGSSCYYRTPYKGGAGFVLIPNAPEVDALSDMSAHYIVNRVMEYISMREIGYGVRNFISHQWILQR
jgi:hypothetical protein